MITCAVCGEAVTQRRGMIMPVANYFVGICRKRCWKVFRAREKRVLEQVAHEFAVERRLLAPVEEEIRET